ncbi:MAG: flagellar hook assembly protein FlgD [Rhodospirillales bacterium]|nr:flagellar hook assembly protein FlgD [Rhodospirillales bacterium]
MFTGVAAADQAAAAGSKSAIAQEKLEDELSNFMTLLTTQLQHQDPLSPMDSTEFTSQLVQFASVEQQIHQNSNLEKLITMQETSLLSGIVQYVDKKIEVPGQQLPLEEGKADFSYTLNEKAESVTINILDLAGKSVYTAQGNISSGVHRVDWDGTDMDGIQLPNGEYHVIVSALDYHGDPIETPQTVIGTVTAVTLEDGEGAVFMGSIQKKLEDIIAVKTAEEMIGTGDGTDTGDTTSGDTTSGDTTT